MNISEIIRNECRNEILSFIRIQYKMNGKVPLMFVVVILEKLNIVLKNAF